MKEGNTCCNMSISWIYTWVNVIMMTPVRMSTLCSLSEFVTKVLRHFLFGFTWKTLYLWGCVLENIPCNYTCHQFYFYITCHIIILLYWERGFHLLGIMMKFMLKKVRSSVTIQCFSVVKFFSKTLLLNWIALTHVVNYFVTSLTLISDYLCFKSQQFEF